MNLCLSCLLYKQNARNQESEALELEGIWESIRTIILPVEKSYGEKGENDPV